MTNQAINKTFLSTVDAQTRDEILSDVARNYGITKDEALEEVTHEDAEHLLDYLTGKVRTAASLLMRRHGMTTDMHNTAESIEVKTPMQLRMAKFKREISIAKQKGIEILPSVNGPYAFNPATGRVIGRMGSEEYNRAISDQDLTDK